MTMITTDTHGQQNIWYSAAETARLVRAALHDAFPGVPFRVRTRVYSGGAALDVAWRDGPTQEMVERITHPFKGTIFDSMRDLKETRSAVVIGGVHVHYGADYLLCRRSYSAGFLRQQAELEAVKWGRPVPEIQTSQDGSAWVLCEGPRLTPGEGETLGELIVRRAEKTAAAGNGSE